MTSRERAALAHDLRMYGALYRSGHGLLEEQRRLLAAQESALRESRCAGSVVYLSRQMGALKADMADGKLRTNRAAWSARNLHLDLLGG